MKHLYKTLFCLCSLSFSTPYLVYAQCTHVILKGIVKGEDGEVVNSASVQNIISGGGVNASASGEFILSISLPAKIKITRLGYQTLEKNITQSTDCDTLRIVFTLKQEINQIPLITVVSDYNPHCVMAADNLLDFEVKDRDLCILTTIAKGRRINIFDSASKLIARRDVSYKTDEIKKTVNNLVYVADNDSVYFIRWDKSNGLTTVNPITLELYNTRVKRVLALNFPYYYYGLYDMLDATVSFWRYDEQKDSVKPFYSYHNSRMSQANIYTFTEEQASGVPIDEVGFGKAGFNIDPDQLDALKDLQKKHRDNWLYYRNAVVLLRNARDSFYVFNFENDSISVFNKANKFIRQIHIDFDNSGMKNNRKDIIVDEQNNGCYFDYNIHGISYIEKINLDNGKKMNTLKLPFPFVKKIRVVDNYVIFSYTDTDSKTYIYRERLF